MKVIKLDRRYAGFPKWQYALDFGTRKYYKLERLKYAKAFAQLYGPSRRTNPDTTISIWSPNWYLYNENWYNDDKHGRILYNNEGDLSMIMLKLSVDR